MSKEKTDSENGEEKQPTGDGQPEKKPADSAQVEKVEISKTELERLQRDSKDKEGLIKQKLEASRAGRTIPGVVPKVKKDKDDDDAGEDGSDDSQEFITKKDFSKNIEKSAIKEAQKDSETDENWDSIMEFYQPRHGKDTVDDILADIQTAKKVWKAEHPTPPKTDKGEGDASVAADLATDTGVGEGKEKKPVSEKKSILKTNKTPMKDWYK